MTDAPARALSEVSLEFCGEWTRLDPDRAFEIGRDADLQVDDNPFLHRRFLQIVCTDGLWWIVNVGSRLSATISDSGGRVQAWLAPGARLPVVFTLTTVIFTAGPTTYEFTLHVTAPPFAEINPVLSSGGETTVGALTFTPTQKLVMLALAEPMLRREGTGMSDIPSSASAAERLGWAMTRFNRKLDNVCDKLDKAGVAGLRGGVGSHATNRRTRLVEYAVASRIVTRLDLPLLDETAAEDAPESAVADQ